MIVIKSVTISFSELIMMPFFVQMNKIYNTITTPYSLNHTLQIYGHFYIQIDTFIATLPVQKKHTNLDTSIISRV